MPLLLSSPASTLSGPDPSTVGVELTHCTTAAKRLLTPEPQYVLLDSGATCGSVRYTPVLGVRIRTLADSEKVRTCHRRCSSSE